MPSKKKEIENRQQQQAQIAEAIEKLEAALGELKQKEETHTLLESVANGLYIEIDKLAKKSPADQVTNLLLGQVNDVIREAKLLTPSDPFMQRYSEFVAAGDNPEHRDVIVVMRQIQQGLGRFSERLKPRREKNTTLLADAKAILVAVDLFIQGNEIVDRDDLKINKVKAGKDWLNEDYEFDFDALDAIDIEEHFKPE